MLSAQSDALRTAWRWCIMHARTLAAHDHQSCMKRGCKLLDLIDNHVHYGSVLTGVHPVMLGGAGGCRA